MVSARGKSMIAKAKHGDGGISCIAQMGDIYMHKDYPLSVGIDNGVTGSIGIVQSSLGGRILYQSVWRIPYVKVPDTKKINHVARRINYRGVMLLLTRIFEQAGAIPLKNLFVTIETPMTNSKRVYAMLSAQRAFEATLIALDLVGVPDRNIWIIRASEWQKEYAHIIEDQRMRWLDPTMSNDAITFKEIEGLAIAHWSDYHFHHKG